jgi:hypothetical protein
MHLGLRNESVGNICPDMAQLAWRAALTGVGGPGYASNLPSTNDHPTRPYVVLVPRIRQNARFVAFCLRPAFLYFYLFL